MSITNSYVFPASGLGYARDACLTKFGTAVPATSGVGYLGTGTYEIGNIYIANPNGIMPIAGNLSPFNPTLPAPVIFGSWIYTVLGGQLPTQQSHGGIMYVFGGTGGAQWTTLAYTGNEALQITAYNGGIMGWDAYLPNVTFEIMGTEVFSVQYQVLDTLPSQIEIQFFEETSLTWHNVYIGADNFGFGGTQLNSIIPPALNSWVQITFTPVDMGLVPGDIISGMAWGIFNQTGTSTVVFSDTANLTAPNTPATGFIDACQDNNVGFYILSHTGPLYQIPAVGAPVLTIPISVSPSFVYTGLTHNPSDGLPYFIGYDGTIYKYNGSTVSTITPPPSGISVPARQLYADNSNNLYTTFANSNYVAKYSIIGNNWVLTTSPFTATLDTLYYSFDNSTVIIGGSNYQNLHITPTIIDTTYASTPNQLIIADNTPEIQAYNFTNGNWTFSQIVGGYTGIPTHIAAEPDGMQVLVTDSTNNRVEVLTYVAGVWNQTSTVALTAPTSLTTYTSGIVQAAVCQPTQNRISFLNKSVLNWAVAQTLAITGPTDIAIQQSPTALNAIVSNSTGVTFLHFNGAVWINVNSLILNPVPTLVAADVVSSANTYMYAAAQSGSNIVVYIFQNNAQVSTYTIIGQTLATFAVVDYEILVGTVSGNLYAGYYIGGTTGNMLTSAVIPISGVSMNWITTVTDFVPFLSVSGPHDIRSYYNDSPQSYTRITDAKVAILNGISWNVLDLDNHNTISSIATDTSGNILAVNTANEVYKWNSAGVLASGWPFQIIPPVGQQEDVPLGLSKLVVYNGQIAAASSLMGGITFISDT